MATLGCLGPYTCLPISSARVKYPSASSNCPRAWTYRGTDASNRTREKERCEERGNVSTLDTLDTRQRGHVTRGTARSCEHGGRARKDPRKTKRIMTKVWIATVRTAGVIIEFITPPYSDRDPLCMVCMTHARTQGGRALTPSLSSVRCVSSIALIMFRS